MAISSFIHDGNVYDEKTKETKKAAAGVSRRIRKMRRRKIKRLKALNKALREDGFIFEEPKGHSFEPWYARKLLVETKVSGKDFKKLFPIAIEHIARHRGWANPWKSLPSITVASEKPTTQFLAKAEDTKERHNLDERPDTYGQIGALHYEKQIPVRGPKKDIKEKELDYRLYKEDLIREFRLICNKQDKAELFNKYVELIFEQKKPKVPAHRVGKDPLPGQEDLPRAPKGSYEFQAYRITTFLKNLRIREHGEKLSLTLAQTNLVAEKLFNWTKPVPPEYIDIAEWLNVELNDIVSKPVLFDDETVKNVPFNKTLQQLKKSGKSGFTKKSDFMQWFDRASQAQQNAMVMFVTDTTDYSYEIAEEADILDTFNNFSEETQDKLENFQGEAGRAAYSAKSLDMLTEDMLENNHDLHEARKAVFKVDSDWIPPIDTLEDPIDHPVVSRVNNIIRRFLHNAVAQWGIPSDVIIETAREGLSSARVAEDLKKAQNKRRKENEELTNELKKRGIEKPSRSDLVRYQIWKRQNCACLYCGDPVELLNSEIDHIVPRKAGGSSKRENLAIACRGCNQRKSNMPFTVFAQKPYKKGISLDEAISRVDAWIRPNELNQNQFNNFKRSIKSRLKNNFIEEQPIDERSIESTAYAAVEMRKRIQGSLQKWQKENHDDKQITYRVYRGGVTSEARKAGEIDHKIRIRGADVKSRLDRRHHAVDATVLTLLKDPVSRVLAVRQFKRWEYRQTGLSEFSDWKYYTGADFIERNSFAKWQKQSKVLADLLFEAIDKDKISVVPTPPHLAPKVGKVHDDTIRPLEKKKVGDEFVFNDLLRICDDKIFEQLYKLLIKNKVATDEERTVVTAAGKKLTADDDIFLLPNTTSIKVRTGAADLGKSTHHIRVIAWQNTKGKVEIAGIVIHGVDLVGIPDDEIFTFKIPKNSGILRRGYSQKAAKYLLDGGKYQQIGILLPGDEVEIDPDNFTETKNEFGRSVQEVPEIRWQVRSFEKAGNRLFLKPLLLAEEGLNNLAENVENKIIEKVVKGSTRIIIESLLKEKGTKIIRRTALGKPRWNSRDETDVFVSWTPSEEIKKHFNQ
ncbi:MAG: HNH endonuclease [Micrococcaceae bacterium]